MLVNSNWPRALRLSDFETLHSFSLRWIGLSLKQLLTLPTFPKTHWFSHWVIHNKTYLFHFWNSSSCNWKIRNYRPYSARGLLANQRPYRNPVILSHWPDMDTISQSLGRIWLFLSGSVFFGSTTFVSVKAKYEQWLSRPNPGTKLAWPWYDAKDITEVYYTLAVGKFWVSVALVHEGYIDYSFIVNSSSQSNC